MSDRKLKFSEDSGNVKIKNATKVTYDGKEFKSRLEVMVYKTLLQAGFVPEYENMRFVLWEGFKPSVLTYDKFIPDRPTAPNMKKIIDITYKPDFTFKVKDKLIIVEAKGKANDTYPIKKKLFRKYLERYMPDSIFFEIHTKSGLMEAIKIINEL